MAPFVLNVYDMKYDEIKERNYDADIWQYWLNINNWQIKSAALIKYNQIKYKVKIKQINLHIYISTIEQITVSRSAQYKFVNKINIYQ